MPPSHSTATVKEDPCLAPCGELLRMRVFPSCQTACLSTGIQRVPAPCPGFQPRCSFFPRWDVRRSCFLMPWLPFTSLSAIHSGLSGNCLPGPLPTFPLFFLRESQERLADAGSDSLSVFSAINNLARSFLHLHSSSSVPLKENLI